MVEPHSSNFRVITTNSLGVRTFRKFTVGRNLSKTDLLVISSFKDEKCTVKDNEIVFQCGEILSPKNSVPVISLKFVQCGFTIE